MTQHSTSGMKNNYAKSFENPRVLSAENLLTKFGMYYRKQLMPAIRAGIDQLDQLSWHTINTYYLVPEEERSMFNLAEQLDCSIPDARYALQSAISNLKQTVLRDAQLDVSPDHLDKLLQYMHSSLVPVTTAASVVQEASEEKRILKQVFYSIIDLDALRAFINEAFYKNVFQVNFLQRVEDDQRLQSAGNGNTGSEERALPEGADIALDDTGWPADMTLKLRITGSRELYLVYEGALSFRGIQIGGGSSSIPWMFFPFHKPESTREQPTYWFRLGHVDNTSIIVLESPLLRVVVQDGLSQITTQLIEH